MMRLFIKGRFSAVYSFKQGAERLSALLYMVLVLLLSISKTYATTFPAEIPHDFLPVNEAFQFSGDIKKHNRVTIHIKVADGYYLYKERLSFHPADNKTRVGAPLFPAGIEIMDPFQGQEVTVFPENTDVVLPYTTMSAKPELMIQFQGCARAGLCYPPSEVTIHLTKDTRSNKTAGTTTSALVNTIMAPTQPTAGGNKYFELLNQQRNLFVIFGLFFIAGILLAFTPCVLPMVPILSATLAGSTGNRRRTIILTLTYIVCMSATYAIAGSLVGMFGATFNLQTWLQSPWVIGLFALLFVVLALSMFGFYELQLPDWLRQRIVSADASISEKRKGSLTGAGFMGICSALVVSPCITAPLVGALLYISSTQSPFLGGLSLFSLGLGMGVPLFAVGIGLGQCVPESGVWMEKIKQVFGILMLGIAIWLISRIILPYVTLVIWGIFILGLGIYCLLASRVDTLAATRRKLVTITMGVFLFIYGACLVIGGFMNNSSFTRPLALSTASHQNHEQDSAEFTRITTPEQLLRLQEKAINEHRPLILDFYADWCESCKRMDHDVFEKPEMASWLSRFALVRFDITKTSGMQLKMMKEMGVFGAPTIIIYDASGKEQTRQVGELSLNEFRQLLQNILISETQAR